MVRRAVLGAILAVVAGWVLAAAASGSSPYRAGAGAARPSELTTPSRACTRHEGDSRPTRWTVRRELVLHTSRPVARVAVCLRIAV